jgi:hypothetical protein
VQKSTRKSTIISVKAVPAVRGTPRSCIRTKKSLNSCPWGLSEVLLDVDIYVINSNSVEYSQTLNPFNVLTTICS